MVIPNDPILVGAFVVTCFAAWVAVVLAFCEEVLRE